MSKIAMEILSWNDPTVAALCTKVAETKNSLWYNAGRNLGKYAGGQAPPTGTKFCKPGNSSTHWDTQCWGVRVKCSLRGHRAESCKAGAGAGAAPPPDPKQAKAAGEKSKKKKKRKTKQAKKTDHWTSLLEHQLLWIILNHLALKMDRKEKVQQELAILKV